MPKLMLVADEVDQIQEAIRELSKDADLILTLGGTGFSPRDVTPEATRAVLDRQAPNLAELLRYEGSKKTPFSYLSRGVAGVRGQTLIVNLPGSPRGVAECIGALAPLLPPILSELRGDGCTVI